MFLSTWNYLFFIYILPWYFGHIIELPYFFFNMRQWGTTKYIQMTALAILWIPCTVCTMIHKHAITTALFQNGIHANISIPPARHMCFIVPVFLALHSVGISIHPCFAAHRTGHGGLGQSIRLPSTYYYETLQTTASRPPLLWNTAESIVEP